LERNIENGLLQIVNVSGEHVSSVLIETDLPKNEKWREESGLLVTRERSVSQDATRRIWGDDPLFRIFLSHRAEVKDEVGRLQVSLQSFGISSFVAHKDIEATEEWQDEIESALATMDCFVALLTKDFHQSYWTDQEVGFAFARSVPIVPVRLGMDPYGFIGKFQALSSKWEDCALSIVKVLIKDDRVVKAYIRALPKCRNWDTANKMASLLPGIRRLTSDQIDDLVAAFNQNPELQTAHGFTGNRPDLYGAGLVWHLNRLGARTFYYDENRKIQVKP